MTPSLSRALSVLTILLASPFAQADMAITPDLVRVEVFGDYTGDVAYLLDGLYTGDLASSHEHVVTWDSPTTMIEFEYAEEFELAWLFLNPSRHDFIIEGSTDGATFFEVFRFLASDWPSIASSNRFLVLTNSHGYNLGPSTSETMPQYIHRSFDPVIVRLLRIRAEGEGPGFAIGEFQALPNPDLLPIPEPGSWVLLGLGAMALTATTHRRRRARR